jgi:ribose transport system substrate-binding protein
MNLRMLGLTVVLLGAVAGCVREAPKEGADTGAPSPAPKSPSTAPKKGPNDRLRIAVVPKGTTHQFWQTVKAGADAAGQEVNAEILWNGPKAETDIQDQIDIINNYASQGVDGVALAATDKTSLVKTVQDLEGRGIPVVTIDSGIDPDVSRCFIATDNVKAAGLAAKEMGRLLGSKGKVAVLYFLKGAGTSDEREKGFVDGVKEFPGIQIVGSEETKSDSARAREAMETLLTANPDLAGVFAANEPNVVGAAGVLADRHLGGKVKLVGFDASNPEIEYMKKGLVQALVVQDPFKMGHDGVTTLAKILRGQGSVPRREDTGATVVTTANMDQPEVHRLLYPLEKR